MLDDDKVLLEERQGEVHENVTSTDSVGTKKLYIESYCCQMNFSDS